MDESLLGYVYVDDKPIPPAEQEKLNQSWSNFLHWFLIIGGMISLAFLVCGMVQ